MIISFVNQKGGTGKTTLAVNFACVSALSDKNTLLIDSDPQMSAMKFRARRPEDKDPFVAVSILTPTVHKDVKNMHFDNCFIDCGARENDVLRSVMLASDYVIIPITPSQFDIWSSIETFKALDEVRGIKDIPGGIVLNQLIDKTNVTKDIEELVKKYSTQYELDILPSMYNRVSFREASAMGLSVVEMLGKKANKAQDDFKRIYKEVINEK